MLFLRLVLSKLSMIPEWAWKVILVIIALVLVYLMVIHYGNKRYQDGIDYQTVVYIKAQHDSDLNQLDLKNQLETKDVALVLTQTELAKERAKKAEPAKVIYRDKITSENVTKTIDGSGLLEMINATSPTEGY